MSNTKKNVQSHFYNAATIAAACLVLAGISVQALCAPQYEQYRGDSQRTGQSYYNATYAPVFSWACNEGPSVGASVALGEDGTAYYSAKNRYFYAVDRRNGSVKWRYATDALNGASAAVGRDGSIYFTGLYGKLYALDSSGKSKWASPFNVGSNAAGSILMGNDGTLYLGTENKEVCAINPDGTLKWRCSVGTAIRQSLAMSPDGSTIYACGGDGRVYAVGTNGQQKWASNAIAPSTSCAIGQDGRIYVGGSDGSYGVYYSLDPSSGLVSWSYNIWSNITSATAIGADGTIYFGCADNRLYALGAGGNLKWTYTANGPIYSAPTIDRSGVVIFGSNSGKLTGLNSTTGTAMWWQNVGATIYSSPVIGADGGIYVTDANGKITKYIGLVASVPEPASVVALGGCLIGMFGVSRLRRSNKS